jgi:hypothetical protein
MINNLQLSNKTTLFDTPKVLNNLQTRPSIKKTLKQSICKNKISNKNKKNILNKKIRKNKNKNPKKEIKPNNPKNFLEETNQQQNFSCQDMCLIQKIQIIKSSSESSESNNPKGKRDFKERRRQARRRRRAKKRISKMKEMKFDEATLRQCRDSVNSILNPKLNCSKNIQQIQNDTDTETENETSTSGGKSGFTKNSGPCPKDPCCASLINSVYDISGQISSGHSNSKPNWIYMT